MRQRFRASFSGEMKTKHALEQLTERLKADDPAALARKKRSTKLQIDQLAGLLRDASTAFADERISVSGHCVPMQ